MVSYEWGPNSSKAQNSSLNLHGTSPPDDSGLEFISCQPHVFLLESLQLEAWPVFLIGMEA